MYSAPRAAFLSNIASVLKTEPSWLLFYIGVGLRLALAFVNEQANDDHLTIIRSIAFEHYVPTGHDAWQAFQPKLYHWTVALLIQFMNVRAVSVQIIIANLVSCAAGITTLWFILRWLQQSGVSKRAGIVGFALLALNPRLIAISSQASNDSLVIMLGTIAIYFGYSFLNSKRHVDFCCFLAATIFAALAKGNGIVIFIISCCTFGVGIFDAFLVTGWKRTVLACWAVVFIIVYLAAVSFLGPYSEQYRRSGSLFTTNMEPAPLPKFFEKTEAYRPGIRSIIDGFFTFRFVDLIREPKVVNSPLPETAVAAPYDSANQKWPDHQTSLWSQLYGRFHFVHFDNWPFSWQTESRLVRWVGRLALMLGLMPSLLLVLGILREGIMSFRWTVGRAVPDYTLSNLLMTVSSYGFLAFAVGFALRLRDYGALKVIYIFPAILAFLWCFSRAYDYLQRLVESRCGWVLNAFNGTVAVLCLVYIIDISLLIIRLAPKFLSKLEAYIL